MSDTSSRVECAQQPSECPKCGHSPLASILYGLPLFSQGLEKEVKEGRITLGGCCVGKDDPAWECTRCGLKIFRTATQ